MDDPLVDDALPTSQPPAGELTLQRAYVGTAHETAAALADERSTLAASGYTVVSDSFTPGRWPWWRYLLAILLIPVLIGVAMLVYLLVVSPLGRRTATLTWSGFPEATTHGPLIHPGAIAQALSHAQAAGGSEARAALESQLTSLLAYFSALTDDARATMAGDSDAAARLRLALESSSSSHPQPEPLAERRSEPGVASAVDRDQLAVLAAGATWAATSSAEAQSMLASLGRQLAPLAAVQAAVMPGLPPVQLQAMMMSGGLGLPGIGPGAGLGGILGGGLPGLPPLPIGPGLPGPRPRPSIWLTLIGWLFPRRPVWVPKPPWDSKPVFIPPFLYDTDKVCAQLAVLIMYTIQQTGTRYRLDAVTPGLACSGDTITLTGAGFGADGIVLFPTTAGPGVRRPVSALTWSDTEITVQVPANAAPGEIRLQIIEKTLAVCHSNVTVHRLGTGIGFAGGQARVFAITANGEASGCLPPNTDVSIEWVTTVAPAHTVSVTISAPGVAPVMLTRSAVGADSVTYRTPNVSQPVDLIVAVSVAGFCASTAPSRSGTFHISVPAKLSVRGIEVTQGVQSFRLDAPVTSTVPTVAGKDTIVRAYIHCDRKGFAQNRLANISGSLRIEGGPTLMPVGTPPTTTAQPWTAIQRSQIGDTLNFRIPAGFCQGTQRLYVAAWGTDECGTQHAYGEVVWQWEPQPALRVRYVRVRDGRPGSATPGRIPSDAEARAIVVGGFDQLPSPPTDIAPAWLNEWNTGQDWLQSDGQQALLDHVNDQHNCTLWESVWPWSDPCPADDGAKWVGVYFEPTGGGKAKRDGNTCVVGMNSLHAGHELGHTLGLKHVLTGHGDTVPNGPYDQLPLNGFLLDMAVDPTALVTVPVPTFDLMSYATNRWISPTNWNRLRGVI
jgi:hypothetical protein